MEGKTGATPHGLMVGHWKPLLFFMREERETRDSIQTNQICKRKTSNPKPKYYPTLSSRLLYIYIYKESIKLVVSHSLSPPASSFFSKSSRSKEKWREAPRFENPTRPLRISSPGRKPQTSTPMLRDLVRRSVPTR